MSERRPLEGRGAVVTGATQGIGLAIARALVEAGASVCLCARDGGMLEDVRAKLAGIAGGEQIVAAEPCDVARRADVDRFTDLAIRRLGRVHVLVNNAGVQGPMGRLEEVDWDEWVRAIEINLFGSVLMCRALIPHFREKGAGKIIQLSGGGATSPMPRVSAYAASKAAVVRFVETLAHELAGDRIDVNAIAPGAVNTRLLDGVIAAGAERVGRDLYERARRQEREGGAPPERAASLAVFLASEASDGITGRLISAIWDPWETLAAHRGELARSDIYTLRRIVPADRGQPWGERSAPADRKK